MLSGQQKERTLPARPVRRIFVRIFRKSIVDDISHINWVRKRSPAAYLNVYFRCKRSFPMSWQRI